MSEYEKEIRGNQRHLDELARELHACLIDYGATRSNANDWLEETRRVIQQGMDEYRARYPEGEEEE